MNFKQSVAFVAAMIIAATVTYAGLTLAFSDKDHQEGEPQLVDQYGKPISVPPYVPVTYPLSMNSPSDRVVGNFIGDRTVFWPTVTGPGITTPSILDYYSAINGSGGDPGVTWKVTSEDYEGPVTLRLWLNHNALEIKEVRIGESNTTHSVKYFDFEHWPIVNASHPMPFTNDYKVNMTKGKTIGIHTEVVRARISQPLGTSNLTLEVIYNNGTGTISDRVTINNWQVVYGTLIPIETLAGLDPSDTGETRSWKMSNYEGGTIQVGKYRTDISTWFEKRMDILNNRTAYDIAVKETAYYEENKQRINREIAIKAYMDIGMSQADAEERVDTGESLFTHVKTGQTCKITVTKHTVTDYGQQWTQYSEDMICDDGKHVIETRRDTFVILEFAKVYQDEGLDRVDQLIKSEDLHFAGPMTDTTVTIWDGSAVPAFRVILERN